MVRLALRENTHMEWDSSLESGIPVIDFEHKELVRQVSGLEDESKPERVKEILDFLADYVVKHFAHEQLMQKSSNYPKAAEHKEAHERFVERFVALENEYFKNGSNPEIVKKITEAVNAWLRDHIMGQDKEFAKFYKSMKRAGSLHNPHM